MAVDNYIKDVQKNPSRATETTPPTCTNGQDGKQAIIKAFEETKAGEDVGGLRVATFLSLACLRTRSVSSRLGSGNLPSIYKSQLPLPIDADIDVMVRAWAEEPSETYREAMALAFYELDYATLHRLYAQLRARKVLTGQEVRPLGAYYLIEAANEEEIEVIQRDWCEQLAMQDATLVLAPKSGDGLPSVDTRVDSFRGLIGNECEATDTMLTEWVHRQNKDLTLGFDAVDSVSFEDFFRSSREVLLKNVEANAFPPTSELSNELVRQGRRELERVRHYLGVIDDANPSCVLAAELAEGWNTDEQRDEELVALLDAWEQAHLDRCGVSSWPE